MEPRVRLTIEEDPETIKRYGHIKPGRAWGVGPCGVRCSGTTRDCTLQRGHRGPHVAHGRFQKVVAVWDSERGARKSPETTRKAVVPKVRTEVWTGGPGKLFTPVWNLVVRVTSSVEEFALLILLVGFIVFAIDWLRLLLG
jgi:hypothetical protein